MTLSARLTTVGFWLGWNFLWLFPQSFVAWSFNQASDYCWRKRIKGVRQLEANLSRVLELPPQDEKIRELSLLLFLLNLKSLKFQQIMW